MARAISFRRRSNFPSQMNLICAIPGIWAACPGHVQWRDQYSSVQSGLNRAQLPAFRRIAEFALIGLFLSPRAVWQIFLCYISIDFLIGFLLARIISMWIFIKKIFFVLKSNFWVELGTGIHSSLQRDPTSKTRHYKIVVKFGNKLESQHVE